MSLEMSKASQLWEQFRIVFFHYLKKKEKEKLRQTLHSRKTQQIYESI